MPRGRLPRLPAHPETRRRAPRRPAVEADRVDGCEIRPRSRAATATDSPGGVVLPSAADRQPVVAGRAPRSHVLPASSSWIAAEGAPQRDRGRDRSLDEVGWKGWQLRPIEQARSRRPASPATRSGRERREMPADEEGSRRIRSLEAAGQPRPRGSQGRRRRSMRRVSLATPPSGGGRLDRRGRDELVVPSKMPDVTFEHASADRRERSRVAGLRFRARHRGTAARCRASDPKVARRQRRAKARRVARELAAGARTGREAAGRLTAVLHGPTTSAIRRSNTSGGQS